MKLKLIRFILLGLMLTFSAGSQSAQLMTPQVKLVAMLYKDFSFEATIDQPVLDQYLLVNQHKDALLKYFHPELVRLIVRDRTCEETTHEICRIDFALIWGNQDPTGRVVQILTGPVENTVLVKIRYANEANSEQLLYKVVNTNSGWRITDISYGNTRESLLEILSRKL